jgi:hypothetical protein
MGNQLSFSFLGRGASGAKAALERAKSHSSQTVQIDPALLEQFGRSMRENRTSGSIPFGKAYLHPSST